MAHANQALRKAFSEIKTNPPAVLARTKRKSGAGRAEKQRIAMALNKARQTGAKIPYAGVKKG